MPKSRRDEILFKRTTMLKLIFPLQLFGRLSDLFLYSDVIIKVDRLKIFWLKVLSYVIIYKFQ
jgi:hypothetical protein